MKVTVCDLHEPFRAALTRHVPDADPFQVIGVATRALDTCRRRVQNETLGHRDRAEDQRYRARKLLVNAARTVEERLCRPLHAARRL